MKLVTMAALIMCAASANAQVFGFEESNFGTAKVLNGSEGSTSYNFGIGGNSLFLPVNWDTSWGGYWAGGWALSQQYDSTRESSDFAKHLYSSIAYKGAQASNTFAIGTNGAYLLFKSNDNAIKVRTLQVSNSTYAYNSMKLGDMFAKKFGGSTGNDPDSFVLVINGYDKQTGLLAKTSRVLLADYRFADNTSDFILEGWNEIKVAGDSLVFSLEGSDVGTYGLNTPAYFCIDNVSAGTNAAAHLAKNLTVNIYPNPASNRINISSKQAVNYVQVLDMAGKLIAQWPGNGTNFTIDLSSLASGNYVCRVHAESGSASKIIVKQ